MNLDPTIQTNVDQIHTLKKQNGLEQDKIEMRKQARKDLLEIK